MSNPMNKVYVITRGEYSDYAIEAIFTNLEAAEKYCAVHPIEYGDEAMIEEWDISDGSEIECEKVYRAISFSMSENGRLYSTEIKYSTKPFILDICYDRYANRRITREISGCIPVNKSIEDREVAKKIIFDHVAKWKAEQAEL